MLKELYDWKRFWCLRDGTFSLDDQGYLRVSEPVNASETLLGIN